MTILPAKVAGVERIIACTPPDTGMVANAASLVAADIAGCLDVFKIGGPWAVASMAYGTGTVPPVNKIVGPGNKYVTAAKMAVFGTVAIDSPAGPSEILVLADDTANPEWIAWDFLSQVEHDQDAAAVLVTPSAKLGEAVAREIEQRFETLPRKEILAPALENNSAILIADTLEQALDFANDYAAEHLEIVTADPMTVLPRIKHAGSIFLGPYAPVPAGDYASGTNHVLPTGQCARMFSGLSTDDFLKKPTFQLLSKEGLQWLAPAILGLAEVEGLPLHAETVKARLSAER
jgi:histidinol dehydrogenase